MAWARKNADFTVITGDVMDFYSHGNPVTAREILKDPEHLFTVGNHEFCRQIGVDVESEKAERLPVVQRYFNNNVRFASRQIGGANLAVMDNGYDSFEDFQMGLLERELDKGLPLLAFVHCPLPTGPVNDKASPATRRMNQRINDRADAIPAVFACHWHGEAADVLPGGRCSTCRSR